MKAVPRVRGGRGAARHCQPRLPFSCCLCSACGAGAFWARTGFPRRRRRRTVPRTVGAVQYLSRRDDFHSFPERFSRNGRQHAVAFPFGDQVGIKKIVPQFPNHGFFLLSVPDGGGQLRLHRSKAAFCSALTSSVSGRKRRAALETGKRFVCPPPRIGHLPSDRG